MAGLVEVGRGRGQRAPPGKFLAQHRETVLAREVGIAPGQLAEPVDELSESMVVGVRVLAHVERREVQPERRHRADQPVHATVRRQLPTMLYERLAHERQVGEQLAGAEVVVTGSVRPPGSDAGAGVRESLA